MEQIAHGHGQMRAQSFSIQVSSRTRCNAGCKFCISRTTPNIEQSEDVKIKLCDFKRLEVGLNYAKYLGATHAILTGKADPTQEDREYLCRMVDLCRKYLPLVDFHTNGVLLHPGSKKHTLLEDLVACGLTMITFSIADFNEVMNHELMGIKKSAAELIPIARDLGLMVRCSLVTNTMAVSSLEGVMAYVKKAGELGAHSVVVREVWIPASFEGKNEEVFTWNQKARVDIKRIQDEFDWFARNPEKDSMIHKTAKLYQGIYVRDPLPWGTPVFVVENVFDDPDHGVNVTFARCDEATTGTVMKSIVHKPNGHGYRNWDSNGDILY